MARPVTENYGIALYGARNTGDPMDVYSVYNVAMVTIDGILHQFKDLIDDLERRMDDAESRLDALEERMSEAESNIENIYEEIDQINTNITNLGNKNKATLEDIIAKIYGGGTIGGDGHVSWGDPGKVPTGNMSVFGNAGMTSYIRTRAGAGADDVRVN